ncbi:XrtA/PEP-CTERM system exopolysaccharide export protein [Magnetospirillum molischianum]|uniref:Uncharacterized protein n=1 Tax=Magnetospirillum molischianum DSM 120 TaxID=1150626 RepID=H8FQB6_MAGML|nr:XrtA/PEP-CTERM system exopolysaccharide export protein [Magnetospirillum molischianum]CCG40554.1 conserved exported hypothetical protein [Magnetospirillum molischianum DSM 120]
MRNTVFMLKVVALIGLGGVAACASLPEAPSRVDPPEAGAGYLIGSGDSVQVFVWRNPDLSITVSVRPDGKVSLPLIDDLPVAGREPSQVAREIETRLAEYVQDPKVTVIMQSSVGTFDQQVRVVGQAAKPQAVSYRKGMTVLDVAIAVGGLTAFADGDRATIVRMVQGNPVTFRVRLNALINNGDMTANVEVAPGDVVMIPQSWF